MRRRSATLAALAVTALSVAACAPQDEADEPAASGSSSDACTPESLDTLEPGTLTIATDQPAYEPWFSEDAPENGEGFEAAVAYAVAEELGYEEGDVTWTRVPFTLFWQPISGM